ncbi:STAS domain-containing protein [Acanthopleuribacter pedis]|uniref:Anti-sigma factor antagonist n=1 Tax=Acanthopleuribacter pedis TaxID=442870 RepID=A0A8J7QBM1_9BACT|nr:STAS domain-containing protein [Acanthopleuribacter pedis]MBO1322606.1 STAS domain-containing protein [Acanthopleuribacter pedis]
MTVNIEKQDHATVIYVIGRLDSVTCSDLEDKTMRTIAEGETNLIMELSDVPFISSAGLRVILLATKKVQGGGKLVLSGLKPQVHEIIEMAGFHNIIKIYNSLDDAKQAFV